MDIVKSENQLSAFLSPTERAIVKAWSGKPLSSVPKAEALGRLLELMSLSHAELGIKPAGYNETERLESLNALNKLVYQDLLSYFPAVSLEEIFLAVKYGLRNMYGEYYGFSTLTVHHFVERYLEDESRNAALARQKRFEAKNEEQLRLDFSKEEREEMGLRYITVCYQRYKESRILIDPGGFAYVYMEEHKLADYSPKEREQILMQAESAVRAEELSQSLNYYKRFQRISAEDHEFNVKRCAREIHLKRYFDFMKEQEKRAKG